MKKLIFTIAIVFIVGIKLTSSTAEIIYDNGTYNADISSDQISEGKTRAADDFKLKGDAKLTEVQFWGVHWFDGEYDPNVSFTLTIYGDDGGPVATNVIGSSVLKMTSVVDTGNDRNGYSGADILQYTAVLDKPIDLSGNVNYWLEIHHNDDGSSTWLWMQTVSGGGYIQTTDGWESHFGSSLKNVAFNLSCAPAANPLVAKTGHDHNVGTVVTLDDSKYTASNKQKDYVKAPLVSFNNPLGS